MASIIGKKSLTRDCAFYESILLPYFSCTGTQLLLEGGAQTRFEKTLDIADFDLARRYLNTCVCDNGYNCGKCEKCRRTLLSLDALGVVEDFYNVFDIKDYRKNRVKHLGWLMYRNMLHKWDMTNEAYQLLKKDIGLLSKTYAMAAYIKHYLTMIF